TDNDLLVNNVLVRTSSGDTNFANNQSSDSTFASAGPADIGGTKSMPDLVARGNPFWVTLVVTNNGPDNVNNLDVFDSFNSSGTVNYGGSFTWSVVSGTVTAAMPTFARLFALSANNVVFEINNFNPGDVVTINFLVVPEFDVVGTVTDTVSRGIPFGSTGDPNPFNDSFTTTNTVVAAVGAQLKVSKTGPATTGRNVETTYTINVSN